MKQIEFNSHINIAKTHISEAISELDGQNDKNTINLLRLVIGTLALVQERINKKGDL